MSSILNLDDLSSTDVKTIKLDGVDHVGVELTVQGYVDRVKRSRDIPEDATVDVKINETVRLVNSMFPTIAEDRLRKLPLAHLSKIVEFTLEAPEDIVTKVESAQGESSGNA